MTRRRSTYSMPGGSGVDDVTDLAAWLTQVLDEDWADVHGQGALSVDDLEAACKCSSPEAPRRVDCPARWASDIAAKRAIIALHTGRPVDLDHKIWCTECSNQISYPCTTLRQLASAYADRPGYREEWNS